MRTLDEDFPVHAGDPGPGEAGAVSESERWKERGVTLRVFVYVFATHLFAGFVYLLFYVGEHAHK